MENASPGLEASFLEVEESLDDELKFESELPELSDKSESGLSVRRRLRDLEVVRFGECRSEW